MRFSTKKWTSVSLGAFSLIICIITVVEVVVNTSYDNFLSKQIEAIGNIIVYQQYLASDAENIAQQRLRLPPRCKQSQKQEKEKYSQFEQLFDPNTIDNWLPYYGRCNLQNINYNQVNYGEMTMTKELLYIHIFKSGGTTIMQGINKLITQKKLKNMTLYTKAKARNKNGNQFGGIKIKDFENWVNNNNNIDFAKSSNSNSNINDVFIFTYVRDPISKFLSAFYEVYRRIIKYHFKPTPENKIGERDSNGMLTWSAVEKIVKLSQKENENVGAVNKNKTIDSVVTLMRGWIDLMYHRIYNYDELYLYNDPSKKTKKKSLSQLYLNMHNVPNTLFLSKSMNIKFIGNLNNLLHDMPIILKPFINDKNTNNDNNNSDEDIINAFGKTMRDRHSNIYHRVEDDKNKDDEQGKILELFSIEKSYLNDDDIKKLCHIFWVDYMCFPFEIPKQCNITEMIEKYYGNHVTYNQCY